MSAVVSAGGGSKAPGVECDSITKSLSLTLAESSGASIPLSSDNGAPQKKRGVRASFGLTTLTPRNLFPQASGGNRYYPTPIGAACANSLVATVPPRPPRLVCPALPPER